jgi:hypothetical protein
LPVIERSDLDQLVATNASPAVTVLLSMRRMRPGNAEDPRRLRALVEDASHRVKRDWHGPDVEALLDRLARIENQVDWTHPVDALAIVVTAAALRVYALPFSVEDRVVVERTFAIRELVRAIDRSRRYRVLVLSGARARMLEGGATRFREVVKGRFPMHLEAPTEQDTPHRDLPIHDPHEGAHRFVFRAVDRALDEHIAGDSLPLVVVAVERDLAYFDDVTAHGRLIVGRIGHDHMHASEAELAALVAPVIERHFAQRRAETVDAIEQAAGRHRLERSVPEVWKAAATGRGGLLVVEDDYRFPARLVDGVLVPRDEAKGGEPLDDAVDHIIETILRHGGEAVLVEPGELREYGPLALALRY